MNDYDKALKALAELREKAESGVPIIVEGKNDKLALESLGVRGRVLCLSTSSMHEVAREAAKLSREAVVLTDFDSAGREAAGLLKDSFSNEGILVDEKLRLRLRRDLGTVFIENMADDLERLRLETIENKAGARRR